MSDKDYTNVLLEDMNSKFDRLIEVVGQMKDEIQTFAKQSDLEEVKADVKVIKAAVTDLSSHVDNHEVRITNLEAA
jgi:uncharacterized protein YoxC